MPVGVHFEPAHLPVRLLRAGREPERKLGVGAFVVRAVHEQHLTSHQLLDRFGWCGAVLLRQPGGDRQDGVDGVVTAGVQGRPRAHVEPGEADGHITVAPYDLVRGPRGVAGEVGVPAVPAPVAVVDDMHREPLGAAGAGQPPGQGAHGGGGEQRGRSAPGLRVTAGQQQHRPADRRRLLTNCPPQPGRTHRHRLLCHGRTVSEAPAYATGP
ncbi:hypothetical protein GCM10020256_27860 [Streptomyces thermocoprophilus]